MYELVSDLIKIALLSVTTIVSVLGYRKMSHVEHATNSLMDARISEAKIASEAIGVLREKTAEGVRQDERQDRSNKL